MSSKLLPLILLAASPTGSNNLAAGYHIGQQWMNTATGAMYKCIGDGSWQQSCGYGDSPTFAGLTSTGTIFATNGTIQTIMSWGASTGNIGTNSAHALALIVNGSEKINIGTTGISTFYGSAPVTVNAGEVRIGGGQINAAGSGGFGKAVNVGTHDDNASYLGVSRLSASNKYAFISAGFASSRATQNDTGMSLNVLDAGGVQIQAIKLASNGAATFVGSVTAAGSVTSTNTLVSASNISPGAGVATSALTIGRETSGGGWIQSYGSSGVEDMRIQPLGGAATFGGSVIARAAAGSNARIAVDNAGPIGTGGYNGYEFYETGVLKAVQYWDPSAARVALNSSFVVTGAAAPGTAGANEVRIGGGQINAADSITAGSITAGGTLSSITTDSATATQVDGLVVGHRSTGTPAAGFGGNIRLVAESTTTNDRTQGLIEARWVTATDASRTARLSAYVADSAATREAWRVEADGSAARIGFLGASAVARQSVGSAATDAATTQTLANNIRTALINLGLCQT